MYIRGWLVLMALGLLVAGGCASSGPTVVTDFDPSTKFSTFRTFAFSGISDRGREVGPTDTSPLRNRIKEMVREQITGKGVREVGLDERPDLLVHLFYGVKDLERTERAAPPPGFSSETKSYALANGTWVPVPTNVTTYEDHEGTLIVNLAESSKQKLVWRAVIRAVLKNSLEQNFGLARKGIADAFKNYPPTTGN